MTAFDLDTLAWPTSRLAEAMEALARKARLLPSTPAQAAPAQGLPADDPGAMAAWVQYVAQQLVIEAEPVDTTYAEVGSFLRGVGPALIPAHTTGARERYLAVWRSGWRGIAVIAPDLATHWLPPDQVRQALTAPVEAPVAAALDRLLTETGLSGTDLGRVRAVLLAEQLGGVRVRGGFLLRRAPSASVWRQVGDHAIAPPIVLAFSVALLQQVLLIATWAILGQTVLSGQWEWIWLWLWALLTVTAVPFQALLGYAEALVGTRLGVLFKTRLLHGILQLQPEEMRHEGAGHFLGRVLDADVVEVLSISSAFAILVSLIQWLVTIGLFGIAGGSWLHSLALSAFVALALVGIGYDWRARRTRFDAYRQMTNDVAERMIGHRTRLAQEDRGQWHVEEDQILERYLALSEQLDHRQTWVAGLPRAWMAGSIALIAYLWTSGTVTPTQAAIQIGLSLLGFHALDTVIANYSLTLDVLNAWPQVRPLFEAASRREPPLSVPPTALRPSAAGPERPLLRARDISFRYRSHGPLVLSGVTLNVQPRDRLLLEGPSGGGKTTLGAVLAGLRVPDSGLLLLQGYDYSSLGALAWRQQAVMAPQFHENHVLTGTMAFNLLLGRGWPPNDDDLREALSVCQALGLGDVLERMPSGLQQIVGESGWQLSHGERSRLYIARALLQDADLLVLDESFAALDPGNLALALRCVLDRAKALVVIAHP
ncbi:MAG: ABC transporter ATP-binding protein [Anaerolineae bacterium]|nr:ABC transporter ATP-binding protein [Anaerolineae bacterium]